MEPSEWLERLTGVGFNEFQRKRNYLINKKDLFSKDPTRAVTFQLVELQICGCIIVLSGVDHKIINLMFPNEKNLHKEAEKMLYILTGVVLGINLLCYFTMLFFLYISESDPILLDLKAREKYIQQQNLKLIEKKSAELHLEDADVKDLNKDSSDVLYKFRELPRVINNSSVKMLDRSNTFKHLKQ